MVPGLVFSLMRSLTLSFIHQIFMRADYALGCVPDSEHQEMKKTQRKHQTVGVCNQTNIYIYIFFNLGFTIFWLYDLSKLLTLPETWHSHLENRSCRYGYISCAGAGGCVAKWTVGMMPNFVQLLTVSAFKDRRSSRDHRCEHLWGSLAKSHEDVAWRLTKST